MKYICIGKNYYNHVKELGNGKVPEEPMYFFKTENAIPKVPGVFPLPDFSEDLHFEVELAVRIDLDGRNIPVEEAGDYYSEVTLGIDFTARDLQRRQQQLGFPWEICKAFEESAPTGVWKKLGELGKPVQGISFTLEINGETRQAGNTADMIFPVARLISHVSRYVSLNEGDILMTGTPEGVGPVGRGDVLVAKLEGETVLEVTVV